MSTTPACAEEISKVAGLLTDPSITLSLYHIATGQTLHRYNGMCPDNLEGHTVRDDECPACQAIMRFEGALISSGLTTQQQLIDGVL